MRVIVTIDGDLLVPSNPALGISGQREEVLRVINAIGDLFNSQHEIVITHGNAPQVGFVLLRAELASHIIHGLPLDICGADTQGATGYLLQQAIQNWLEKNQVAKEAFSLITQVLVDPAQITKNRSERGIGPFFDQEKAQTYRNTRGWSFVLIPGRGYRRAVPALTPKAVPEIQIIRRLLNPSTIIVCGGGGGIPVIKDKNGLLSGVEAVVNKADTAALLARELQAEGIIFVSVWDRMKELPGIDLSNRLTSLSLNNLQEVLGGDITLDDDSYHKLIAAREFLEAGGKWVLISPPDGVRPNLGESQGILYQKDLIVHR
jgi:carbamate kinase